AGKGYRQDGDEMVCQNCRMRFASVKVMEVKGGCNPSPLPNRVENGQVVIQVTDIEAGGMYFKPGQEG
ncbi:MAG: Fe-S-containing protein, partial [Deferrisomatales bacterium]|nr:Fe-S-containing protein [Deferrisomatales bacterium]